MRMKDVENEKNVTEEKDFRPIQIWLKIFFLLFR